MICSPDFTWQATAEWASGCISDGKYYSVGGIDNGPNTQAIKTECQQDGTWKRVVAE